MGSTSHDRLTKFTLCLPINLPEGRNNRRKDARTKWTELKEKWQTSATRAGRSIEIRLWDETQFGLRLSKPEHQGMFWFWFDSEQRFTLDWFRERLEESIQNAGDRYTPEVHVDLPIAQLLAGAGRSAEFHNRVGELLRSLHAKHRWVSRTRESGELQELNQRLALEVEQLSLTMQSLLPTDGSSEKRGTGARLPLDALANTASNAANSTSLLTERLVAEVATSEKDSKQDEATRARRESLRNAQYHLRDLETVLHEITYFAGSSQARLANLPALLITGNAGNGKTHLLCDVAARDLRAGHPRILLHGSHFHDSEPWVQMIEQLGLDCSVDQFLGGLNATAQAHNCRILLFIDALNEGPGSSLWLKYLAGILVKLRRLPWLGICISVRTTYEDLIVPGSLSDSDLIRETHSGFSEHEYEAVQRFFSHYGIVPTFPLLVPEFTLPLFLKLFCQAMRNQGLTQIPTGLRGITGLLTFFLDSVNAKLSRPGALDFNLDDRVVHRSVDLLAEMMAIRDERHLPREIAEEVVNDVLPRDGYERSLFRHLVHEGVLAVDRWRWTEGSPEVVYFVYERFGDHIIAKYLLEKYAGGDAPLRSFSKRGRIGKLFKDRRAASRRQGLMHALCVQVPEQLEVEFPRLIPHLEDSHMVRDALVESIVWRQKDAFTDDTESYINEHILKWRGTFDAFWDAMLMVAPTPDHPYNADRLHNILMRNPLPDRDAWWSTFLHNEWDSGRSVDRLVEWACEDHDKTHLSDDVVRLASIALTWLLTSANRFLRDRATKGLVRLLEDRITILQSLLERFRDVDDPYVTERLYAVAYGCAMRSDDRDVVAELALQVYRGVFLNRRPPIHVRTRDYARGIIELAMVDRRELEVDVSRIRPPYRSAWPKRRPKTEKSLVEKMVSEEPSDANLAVRHLIGSIKSTMEDFCKYIIDDLDEWSCIPISEPARLSRREICRGWEGSLTTRQRDVFSVLRALKEHGLSVELQEKVFERRLAADEVEEVIKSYEEKMRRTLRKGSRKYQEFEEDVIPFLDSPYTDERRFDVDFARAWILQRVVELGWTATRFGAFDLRVDRYSNHGRSAHKPERIGKKYQWIAYCELIARISDNFRMSGNAFSDYEHKYSGPWQVNRGRDIDPSLLLTTVKRNSWTPSTQSWWFKATYNNWDVKREPVEWIRDASDLPDPVVILEARDESDGSEWLALEGYYTWEEPTPLTEDRHSIPRRQIKYWVRSYLIRSRDSQKFFNWGRRQSFYGRDMSRAPQEYDLFLGEFFWSPAYACMDTPYYSRDGWTRGHADELPCDLLVTNEEYVRESSNYDCSIDDNIFMTLPCKEIARGMGLRGSRCDSRFVDASGVVIAFDPSVREHGPGCLLIRRGQFVEYLDRQNLEVFWTVSGERWIIGGRDPDAEYVGHMEVSGLYRLVNGGIRGELNTVFKSRKNEVGRSTKRRRRKAKKK